MIRKTVLFLCLQDTLKITMCLLFEYNNHEKRNRLGES